MSDENVVFLDEDNNENTALTPMQIRSRQILGKAVKPGMVVLLKKWGIVKTEHQGYLVMLGVAIACLLVAAFIFTWFVLDIRPKEVKVNPNLSPSLRSTLPPSLRSLR